MRTIAVCDVSLTVKNLTNEEGMTATNTAFAALNPSTAYGHLIRPRTIGISGSYRFD